MKNHCNPVRFLELAGGQGGKLYLAHLTAHYDDRMRRVYLATSNPGKLCDFHTVAGGQIPLTSLPDFPSLPEVMEDGLTFEANAIKKAEHYSHFATGELLLADDSGLSVTALHGAPGVHSARYSAIAGEHSREAMDAANNAKVLAELSGQKDRSAKFVCVIAAAKAGRTVATFTGETDGEILYAPRGNRGFGYDPLFFFPALKRTFAELTPAEKANVSHRGKAFRKFLAWYGENEGAI